jgi:hypothetical protein
MQFHSSPHVTAVHAIDVDSVRAPFVTYPFVSGYEPDEGEAIHIVERLEPSRWKWKPVWRRDQLRMPPQTCGEYCVDSDTFIAIRSLPGLEILSSSCSLVRPSSGVARDTF